VLGGVDAHQSEIRAAVGNADPVTVEAADRHFGRGGFANDFEQLASRERDGAGLGHFGGEALTQAHFEIGRDDGNLARARFDHEVRQDGHRVTPIDDALGASEDAQEVFASDRDVHLPSSATLVRAAFNKGFLSSCCC
jgi:hypothetical protein